MSERMQKEIRVVDHAKGIVRVTTTDERWYARPSTDPTTGLPVYDYVPSVTWICEHYPKGIGFYKWLASTGWDESQALKEAAGDKGSRVHQAISALLDTRSARLDDLVMNPSTAQTEPFRLEEYGALMSFVAWHNAALPVVLAKDLVVWNDTYRYAGTIDLLCQIGAERWLIDFKTSQGVWMSHKLQVSAYKHATPAWADVKLGILQIGYKRNKDGFKFTPVDELFPLFLSTREIWAAETARQSPQQKDYPLVLSLAPVAPAQASQGAAQEPPAGGTNGTVDRGTEGDGVRKGAGRRVAGRPHRGSAVRRAPRVQGQGQSDGRVGGEDSAPPALQVPA